MARIIIPSDPATPDVEAWAEIRDPADLRQKDRRVVQAAGDVDGGPNVKVAAVRDRLIATVVTNWSLPLPVPTVEDTSSLDALTFTQYDALVKATDPAAEAMNTANNLGDPKDPASPTEPSTA